LSESLDKRTTVVQKSFFFFITCIKVHECLHVLRNP
jgi:hypothetical protein